MLREIFGPADCARCRLCCNFHLTSVWESPFLPEKLAMKFRNEGVRVECRKRGGWSFSFHFEGDEAVNCPMLDVNHGCTLGPEEKPFECQIWPLRLMEKDGKLVIGRYRNCPALAGTAADRLDRLTVEKLLGKLLEFVGEYPGSVREFSPEYDVIWSGPLPPELRNPDRG